MASLISAYNPDYSKKAAILTGKLDIRVVVEVEDNIDSEFWKNVLCEQCPGKEFHFNPYHTIINGKERNNVKGKSRIMKMAGQLDKNHIACIDSDYDWLLSDYTDDGKVLVSNKYLIHTYAYSIENLMCEPLSLTKVCEDAVGESPNLDFSQYLQMLSAKVYPLLIWSLHLYSKGHHDFTPNSWREVLINNKKNLDELWATVDEKITSNIEKIVKKHRIRINDKATFESKMLTEKDLTPDNAYLYIRGHELFDHLLNAILWPLTRDLLKKHIDELKTKGSTDVGLRIQEYRKSVKPVKEILSRNYSFKKNSPLYNKIISDINSIWT